jgi:hypothetical protein
MKKLSLLLTALAFPVLALGCGGDDKAPPTPIEKCQALVSAVCNKLVACNLTPTTSSCAADAATALDCQRAVGVSANYETCMAEVTGATCDNVQASNQLPASCSKTITLK